MKRHSFHHHGGALDMEQGRSSSSSSQGIIPSSPNMTNGNNRASQKIRRRRMRWIQFQSAWFRLVIGASFVLLSLTVIGIVTLKIEGVPDYKSNQFPTFGTPEFAQECGWTMTEQTNSCNFFISPSPKETEGISRWIADIAEALVMAKQAGCGLLFDYGPDIEIQEVLTPISLPTSGQHQQLFPINWTVPNGFTCTGSPQCVRTNNRFMSTIVLPNLQQEIGLEKPILKGPDFRSTYEDRKGYFLEASYYKTFGETALPGFTPETGMACALGSLLQLSPFAFKFEPNMFTKILPTLQQKNRKVLIMSIYMRTNYADFLAHQTKYSRTSEYNDWRRERDEQIANETLTCALQVEQEYLQKSCSHCRVVWMLITDSPEYKRLIQKSYDTTEERRPTIHREILTTSSGGEHSKPRTKPSTPAFAQAFLDWYLIGESHVVVNHGGSYGHTAAARTHRPFYAAESWHANPCSQIPIFSYKEEEAPKDKK